jgi:hemerythrin superfamily protein
VRSTIHERLNQDHERLALLFDELENAVEGADRRTVQAIFTEFEASVLAHIDAEERWLFPALELRHRKEVTDLRREHSHIRRLISDLGIRADLGTLRKDVADELIGALRAHAAREDGEIYRLFGQLPAGFLARAVDEITAMGRDRVI